MNAIFEIEVIRLASWVVRPIHHFLGFTKCGYKAIISFVSSLFVKCGPLAIFRTVVSFVINSVYRELFFISVANRPLLKHSVITPLFAESDSASSIVDVGWKVGVGAARPNSAPNSVKSSLFSSVGVAMVECRHKLQTIVRLNSGATQFAT